MRSSLLSAALAMLPLALPIRGEPFDIGGRRQLFIDHRFVAESRGVELSVHPPEKIGPVLTGTEPWDNGVIDYGTVMEDHGRFRMWYTAAPVVKAGEVDQSISHLCYAESDDALRWTKPRLGVCDWKGSKANNIILEVTHPSACVLLDPKAPAAEGYKLIARLHARSPKWPNGNAPEGSGIYIYTSPDGLRWTFHPKRVFPFDPDTQNMAFYDRRTGNYLAYVRTWNPWRRVGLIETDNLVKPWPYRHETPGVRSNRVGPPTAPSREVEDAFGSDGEDPPNLDFYTSAVVEYPWADDAYLMFPSAYGRFPEPPAGKYSNDGILDIDLAVSRDGHKFHRLSRFPYIGLGLEGSGDNRTMYMVVGMLRRDNDLYQYYAGTNYTHGGYLAFTEMRNCGAIFAVRQRLDGFVSADAGSGGGQFATPPVLFRGRRLRLNRDASAAGEILCELETVDGKPLAGFAFSDCDPQNGNEIDQVVTWRRGQSDLSQFAGRPVRLAFRLRLAKLYSFQFGEP